MSVYIKDSQQKAQACIIWMHGLGADASDMAGLADQIMVKNLALRHVFMDAPSRPVTLNGGAVMPAWYDIVGLELTDREDRKGVEASESLIKSVVETQVEQGFTAKQIYLAGFSQGGAMALYTALGLPQLGGVISLSAYLPLAKEVNSILALNTPIFMGYGQFDPLVLPTWTQQTRDWLQSHGYTRVDFHPYPMEHSICFEEIKDLGDWLNQQIQGVM